MNRFSTFVAAALLTTTVAGFAVWKVGAESPASAQSQTNKPLKHTFPPDNSTKRYVLGDAQWRKVLTKQQYYVLRQKGTDAPYTGSYERTGDGVYRCVGCNNILFSDDTQFDSGTGWPSFWKPLRAQSVRVSKDEDGERDEVTCARCGGHLGHVFNDGPKPTGLRFCMDQSALKFVPTKK